MIPRHDGLGKFGVEFVVLVKSRHISTLHQLMNYPKQMTETIPTTPMFMISSNGNFSQADFIDIYPKKRDTTRIFLSH